MRGKIVNLCIGFTNLLFGILIIVFTIIVPQDKTLLTIQESIVVKYIVFGIYVLLSCIVITDALQYYNHRRDTVFNTAYLIGIFAISFVFIKEPAISAFSIISGIIVIFKSLKENLVEIDSTTAISFAVVLMIASVIISGLSFSYKSLGEMIKNKENKDELAYQSDYFKYVTELNIEEAYINIKKDGKYGYISQNGNVVIDFLYDFASPFVKIKMYNKQFEIALVCQDGSSYIILKNGRKVMSYRSESADENYGAKFKELEDIYINTLGQAEPMKFEIEDLHSNTNKVPSYKEVSNEYTFRYDYNEEYDVIITQSSLGLGDKYELAKKDNLDIRLALETTDLDYDSNYLYLYSNGNIPFYETSKLYQGWFTSYGKKNEMRGKAQILEFFGEKILIRNYNNNKVYFSDLTGNALSELYKDIFICQTDRYIVKTEKDKMKVIDANFNKIFEQEYDKIETTLTPRNLYLGMNLEEEIKFNDYDYAKMNFTLLDSQGNIILDNIEQIYSDFYKLPEGNFKTQKQQYNQFIEDLKNLKYNFVGDKFYYSYK